MKNSVIKYGLLLFFLAHSGCVVQNETRMVPDKLAQNGFFEVLQLEMHQKPELNLFPGDIAMIECRNDSILLYALNGETFGIEKEELRYIFGLMQDTEKSNTLTGLAFAAGTGGLFLGIYIIVLAVALGNIIGEGCFVCLEI